MASLDRRGFLRSGGLFLGAIPLAQLLARVPAPAAVAPSPLPLSGDLPSDPAWLTIAEAVALMESGELTSAAIVDACLARVAVVDPHVQAWVEVYGDEARAAAAAADERRARPGKKPPLLGVPFGHKDLYDVEGKRTRAGSKVREDVAPAARDATVVERLRDAGALVLGKTRTHEYAYGVWTPPTSNPWDRTKVPGGSSGGSAAALAAGMTIGTTGSDTGGSIRIPSSLCNTVGLKPTYGRSSRAGVVPLAWTLDHTGPVARAVEDCALVLNAIAGYDERDPTTLDLPKEDFTSRLGQPVAGMRVGVPSTFADGAEADVLARLEDARAVLASLGITVVDVPAPPTQRIATTAYLAIQLSEPLAVHEHELRRRPHDYQQQTQVLLGLGPAWTAQHYLRAQRVRAINIVEWLELFDAHELDAVLTPTTPRAAPSKEEAAATGVFELVNYTAPFDMNGFPAISVPAGFTAAGLPVGAQLAARPFDEARLLQIAYAFQQATGFHRQRPPV